MTILFLLVKINFIVCLLVLSTMYFHFSDSFNYTMATDTFTQWTHIAFTWNQSKRKSEVFINGLKKTEHVFNTSTGEIEFSTNRILEIKTEAAGNKRSYF